VDFASRRNPFTDFLQIAPDLREAHLLLLRLLMNPKALALQARTRAFANRVIRLCEALPATPAADSIREQLLDSSGGTDSNYRAACRARTRKEFIAKLGLAVEESDESLGWLQLLIESSLCTTDDAGPLRDEANELVSIFVKSEKTAKDNYEKELARRRAAQQRKSRKRR
jgi:four helix bundle protein